MSDITIIQNFVRLAGYKAIEDVFKVIKDPRLAQYFDELRLFYRNKKHYQYKFKKEALDAFVITGKFLSGRDAESLVEYSGMLILDLDHLGDKLPTARAAIIREPYTYACFLSPSGDGLKVIVRVDTASVDHGKAFTAVANHYEAVTKVEIDRCGKNINRLCFLSYDPNLFVNEQAHTFRVPEGMRNLQQQLLF